MIEASADIKIMEQGSEFCCLATACDQQWLFKVGENGILYSQKQNRIAGLNAGGLLTYRAFDAGASLQDLREVAGSPAAVDALDTIFALSQGRFPEPQEAEQRRDWPP